jgi:hypothetical protein
MTGRPSYSIQITLNEAWRLFNQGHRIVIERSDAHGPALYSLGKDTCPDYSFRQLQSCSAFFALLSPAEVSLLSRACLIQAMIVAFGVLTTVMGGLGILLTALGQRVLPILYISPPYCYWILFLTGTLACSMGVISDKASTVWAEFSQKTLGRN